MTPRFVSHKTSAYWNNVLDAAPHDETYLAKPLAGVTKEGPMNYPQIPRDYPVPSPAPRLPREVPPCGHVQEDENGYQLYPTRVQFMHLKFDGGGTQDRPEFRCLIAGDRKLSASRCEHCRLIEYSLETLSTGTVANIGEDQEVVTAALAALLNDPAALVATLVVQASKRVSIVLPRHHLPTFVAGRLNPW